jgi:ABC-type polysaccharide/polyol phosphate export permease
MEYVNTSRAQLRSAERAPSGFGLAAIGLRELWTRRLLIGYLVRAQMHRVGADRVLGNLWWVLDPVFQVLLYTLVIEVLLGRGQPDYPLFVFAALLPWKWFTAAISDATSAVSSRERLVRGLWFPKIVLPAATTFAGLVHLGFGLLVLGAVLAIGYPERVSVWLLAIPAIAAVQLVLTLALAFIVSAATVFYRDLGNLARHVLRFWFYLSPALYGVEVIDSIAERVSFAGQLARLNPFYTLLGSYRRVIYQGSPPDWHGLLVVLFISSMLLLVAAAIFKRAEPSFAKVL